MAKVSKKNIDTKKENKSLANDSEKLPPADIEKQILKAFWENDDAIDELVNKTHSVYWKVDANLCMTHVAGKGLIVMEGIEQARPGIKLQDFIKSSDINHPTIQHHLSALKGNSGRYYAAVGGRIIDVYLEPIFDGQGKVAGVKGLFFDITERSRHHLAGETLPTTITIKGIPTPSYIWEKSGDDFILKEFNDAAYTITHGTIVKARNARLRDLYKEKPELIEDIEYCYNFKNSFQKPVEYVFIHTGEKHFLNVTYTFVPSNIVAVHTEDITERKKAEEELKRIRQMYHQAISNAKGIAYFFKYSNMTYEFFEEDGEKLLGIPTKGLTCPKFNAMILEREIFEPEYCVIAEPCEEHVHLKGAKRYVANYRIKTAEEEDKWLMDCAVGIRDTFSEELIGSLGILFEISDRKRLELEREALQRIAEGLTTILDFKTMGSFLAEEFSKTFRHEAFLFTMFHDDKNEFISIYEEDTPEGAKKPVKFEPGRINKFSKHNPFMRDLKTTLVNRKGAQLKTDLSMFGCKERISRSSVFAPLVWENRLIGLLSVQSYTPGKYGERDIRLMRGIAELCAGAAARIKVIEAIRIKDRAMESSINAMLIADLEGRITYVNSSFLMMWNYDDPKEVLGKKVSSLWNKEKEWQAALQKMTEQGGWRGDLSAQTRDGHVLDAQISLSDIRDAAGKSICLLCSVVDVTGHNLLKKALTMAEFSIEHVMDGVLWIDPTSRIMYANKAICHILGYTLEELMNLSISDINPSFPMKKWGAHWKETQKKKHMVFETVVRKKDGALIPIEISINFITYKGQEFHCSYMRDITERLKTEEAIRKSHQIYRSAIRSANGVAYSQNFSDWTYDYFDKEGGALLGIPLDGLTAKKFSELVKERIVLDPDAPPDIYEYGAAFMRGEIDQFKADYRVVVPSGEEKWLRDCSVPLKDEKTSKVIGSLGILYDITELKRTELEKDALQHIIEKLSTIIDPREMGKIIAQECYKIFRHDAFWLSIWDEEHNIDYGIYAEDTPPDGNAPVPVENIIMKRLRKKPAYWDRKPKLIERDEPVRKDDFQTFGYNRISRSIMLVPFIWQDKLLGCLSVQSYTKHKYSERDLKFLNSIANHCASTVERMEAMKSLRIKDWAIESSTTGFAISNMSGKITYANHAFMVLWNFDDISDIVGKSFISFWEDRNKAQEAWRIICEEGDWRGKLKGVCEDETTFNADISASLVIDPDGQPVNILLAVHDISKAELTDEALAHAKFCMDNAADAILWIRTNDKFFYVNNAATMLYGYTHDELMDMRAVDLDAFPEKVNMAREQLRKKGFVKMESVHIAKDGRRIPVEHLY